MSKEDVPDTEAWKHRLLSAVAAGLRSQQRAGVNCDVTIMVEGIPYQCHKAVLCAVSPYFSAMFANDMKESLESVVMLHDIKPETFERLLDCVYDGDDVLTDDNIQEILEVASMMQIDVLLERIEKYLREKLSVDNFVDIWYVAKKYSCQRLEQFIWKFMTNKFVALSQNGDLSLLPLETLEALLGDDHLCAPSEDFISDVALQWITANTENRLQHVSRLMSCLRLPLCSPEYIMYTFSKDPTIGAVPAVVSMIQEALQYKMCPARKQDSTSTSTTHRQASRQDDVMVVIGGTDTLDYAGSGMRCFSFQRQRWFTLPSLPKNVGPHYGICTHGDDIYVSGGQYHREAFYRFQASTCTWTNLASLPSSRAHHSMTSVADVIFVLGGDGSVDTKEIYGYLVTTGLWEQRGELKENVNYAKSVALGHNILIFGSNSTEAYFSEVVQVYDSLHQQVTLLTSATIPGAGSHVLMCDDTAYVIGSDGKVTTIDSGWKTKAVGSIDEFNPKRFDVVQYRGCLFITKGAQSTESEASSGGSSVTKVDLKTLTTLQRFPIPPSQHGDKVWLNSGTRLACAKIAIGKHHLRELTDK